MFKQPSPDIALNTNDEQHTPTSVQDDVETVVGPSVVVEGDFSSGGNILVKGTVLGSVKTSKLLTVERGAKILANVRAGDTYVSGEIKGNVKADRQVELTETARVVGDVHCKTLVVAAGAQVRGKIEMKGVQIDDNERVEEKSVRTTRKKTTKSDEK